MENELDKEVVELYKISRNLTHVAKVCKISDKKVRKILLSNGIVPYSSTTNIINRMYNDGMSINEIALRLRVSRSTVVSHLPYQKDNK